jgi:hypothetical protein
MAGTLSDNTSRRLRRCIPIIAISLVLVASTFLTIGNMNGIFAASTTSALIPFAGFASTNTASSAPPAAGTIIAQQGTISSNAPSGSGAANVTLLAPASGIVYTGTISYTASKPVSLYILHSYGISSTQTINSLYGQLLPTITIDGQQYIATILPSSSSSSGGQAGGDSNVFSGNGLLLVSSSGAGNGQQFVASYKIKAAVDAATTVNDFGDAIAPTTTSTSTSSVATVTQVATTSSGSGNSTTNTGQSTTTSSSTNSTSSSTIQQSNSGTSTGSTSGSNSGGSGGDGTGPSPAGPDSITVYAKRIPSSYWAPCFATSCSAGTGPGAKMFFSLQDSSGNVVQTGFADENGYSFTGLNPQAQYYLVYPADCDYCHNDPHNVVFSHWQDGSTDRPRAVDLGQSVTAYFEYVPLQ